MTQGNTVLAAMAEVFKAFREQEDARQAPQASPEHPLLAVDPTALREALAQAGSQTQGMRLYMVQGSALALPACSSTAAEVCNQWLGSAPVMWHEFML